MLGPYNKAAYFEAENKRIDRLRHEGTALFNIARAEGGWGEDTMLRKDEIVAKISAGVKAALANPDVKKKMRDAKLGIPRTAEEKRKTSEGLKGIKRSPETRAKMSAGLQAHPKLVSIGREFGAKNLMKLGDTPQNAVTVQIRGVSYSSVKAAARATGIPYSVLLHVRSPEKYKLSKKWKGDLPNVCFSK